MRRPLIHGAVSFRDGTYRTDVAAAGKVYRQYRGRQSSGSGPKGRSPERRPIRNQLAPAAHSITLSARARNAGGTVKPSALAVLRLMTNSNMVGCSTGRSAGWAPFRILSTQLSSSLE